MLTSPVWIFSCRWALNSANFIFKWTEMRQNISTTENDIMKRISSLAVLIFHLLSECYVNRMEAPLCDSPRFTIVYLLLMEANSSVSNSICSPCHDDEMFRSKLLSLSISRRYTLLSTVNFLSIQISPRVWCHIPSYIVNIRYYYLNMKLGPTRNYHMKKGKENKKVYDH